MRVFIMVLTAALCVGVAGCKSGGSDAAGGDHEARSATSAEASLLRDTTTVSGASATLTVYGLSCPLCANSTDQQLLKVAGVTSVEVDLGEGKVKVGLSGDPRPTRAALTKAVKDAGFTVIRIEEP